MTSLSREERRELADGARAVAAATAQMLRKIANPSGLPPVEVTAYIAELGPRCTPIHDYRTMTRGEMRCRPEYWLPWHQPATVEIRSRAEIHLEWLKARISARIEREEQWLRDVEDLHLSYREYRDEVMIEPHSAWHEASVVLAEARRRRRARQERAMTSEERARWSVRAAAGFERMLADADAAFAREAAANGFSPTAWELWCDMSDDETRRLSEPLGWIWELGADGLGRPRWRCAFVPDGSMDQWRALMEKRAEARATRLRTVTAGSPDLTVQAGAPSAGSGRPRSGR